MDNYIRSCKELYENYQSDLDKELRAMARAQPMPMVTEKTGSGLGVKIFCAFAVVVSITLGASFFFGTEEGNSLQLTQLEKPESQEENLENVQSEIEEFPVEFSGQSQDEKPQLADSSSDDKSEGMNLESSMWGHDSDSSSGGGYYPSGPSGSSGSCHFSSASSGGGGI